MSQAMDAPWTASGTVGGSVSPPLRGRAAEQELLTRWVRRHLHRDGGGVIWIEGPAGVGMSRILAFAGAEARVTGARVFAGAGVACGSLTPLAPLLDALTGDGAFADRLRSGPPQDPYWLLREVAERLRVLTRDRPAVILLDDVHHCDDLTLLAVRTLTARLADLPLLWVLASRVPPGSQRVESLRRDLLAEHATRLELSPLTPQAARQMSQDLLGPLAAAAARYVPYLDGFPGPLHQLCASLRFDSAVTGPGRQPTGRDDVRAVLAPLIARRLDRLSDDARELVLVASALRCTLTVRHLSKLLDRPESAMLGPLREVLAARLLQASDNRLSFPHLPVRDIVADTLPRPFRQSVRRRSTEVRMKAGAPAASLASELIEAAEPEDAWAGRVLRDAAQELAPVSPATAARYLERAVELAGALSPEGRRLSVDLVALLWRCGDVTKARDLALELVQAPPDPVTHARACLELTRLSSQFRVPEPDVHVRHVHRTRKVPVAVKRQLLTSALLNRLLAGEEAADTGPEALARVRGADPVSGVTHRLLRSMSACRRQDWTEALKHSDASAVGAARLHPSRASDIPEAALAASWRASLLNLCGDGPGARNLAEEATNDAKRRGRRALVPLWRVTRTHHLLDAGRVVAAARELAAADTVTADIGMASTAEPAALYARARVALHTGDDTAIEACAARASAWLSGRDPLLHRTASWIMLIAALHRDQELSEDRLGAAAHHLRAGHLHTTVIDPADTVVFVRAAIRSGLREAAASAVVFAETRAARNPGFSCFEAVAAHARGLLDGDRTRLGEAAERYGAARPLLKARAWEDAGEVLVADRPGDARGCFEKALAAYEWCEARQDERRVRSLLRRAGVRPAAACPAPDTGWRGLTPSELGVVRLIAHGATNRQAAQRLFLSPHTVNTHVRHAFEKLGVRSRVQLARLYLQEMDQHAEAPS
ncbi:helix-turn-helix transcriptional regulator [Streptomyces mexicanus]|uniref:helix-turn-helix transcriptional regulator n=1 Tax=Streptomyces mexicanus TaxID=178566 RepID=UPI0036909224